MSRSRDHPLDDGGLLPVLLSEHGQVRPDDLEELGDDGADAVEVPRAERSAELLAQALHVHDRGVALRVDVGGLGHEDDVGAGLFQQGDVAFEVSRVSVEVLAGTELRGVHEDADHDAVGELAGYPHELRCPSWR